jgi:sucrose-6-phosphate hydrolase SacC (GH32 family)
LLSWPRAKFAVVIIALGPMLLARPGESGDPWRPAYHFTAPMGWMNDPNGLVQVGGTYHLFYQFHPFGMDWGPMHWGHAISTDLVRWAHQPIALAPTPGGPDAGGCFSGSAVDDGGVLSLVYTGHGPAQVQCLATSADGRTFTKHPGNPVIAAPPAGFAPADFRDPKVWRAEGRWWLVAGTKRDGKGKALLYESADLRRWTFKAVMAESDGTEGAMWECPDVFALGDRHLLIVSPNEGVDRPKVFAITGTLDYATGRFTQESHRLVDHGFDFYAPQTFQDAGGRRILIGWMENWARKAWPTKAHGWAGAMTVPRIVGLRADGVPTSRRSRSSRRCGAIPCASRRATLAPAWRRYRRWKATRSRSWSSCSRPRPRPWAWPSGARATAGRRPGSSMTRGPAPSPSIASGPGRGTVAFTAPRWPWRRASSCASASSSTARRSRSSPRTAP